MSDSQSPSPPGHPSERIEFAEADLGEADTADLPSMTNADLVLLIERLRGSFADVIHVRISAPEQRAELDAAEGADLAVMGHAELVDLADRLRRSLARVIAILRAS